MRQPTSPSHNSISPTHYSFRFVDPPPLSQEQFPIESPGSSATQERGFSTMIVQGGVGPDINVVWSGRKEMDGVSSGNDTDCGSLKAEGDEKQNRKWSQIYKKVK